MADDQTKSTWGSIKTGFANAFKPMDAAADDDVAKNRKEYGDQYNQDRAKGAEYMRDKFKKGFFESQ